METQSAFMGAAAGAVLLLAVLVQRRWGPAAPLIGLILSYTTWCLGRGAQSVGHPWGAHLVGVGLSFLGPLILATAAGFVRRHELLRRAAPFLGLGALLWVGALLIVGPDQPQLKVALGVWAIAGAIGGVVLLGRPGVELEEAGSDTLTRLRYLAVAHGIATLGALSDVVAWRLGLPIVVSLLSPLFYLYVGYLNLARVRVADLRQMAGNSVALALMAAGLAGLFAAIRIWVGERVDLFVFNAFVLSFVLLLAFSGVRSVVHRAIDRLFVADRLELERCLRPLTERLAHVFTLDEILRELLDALEGTSRLRTSSVFLRDDKHLGFQQAGSLGLPPRTRVSLLRDPVWVDALERQDVLLSADLHKLRSVERDVAESRRLEALSSTMLELDAEVVLPLRADDKLLGFWTLKDARSEESLSTSELELLGEVADRLALSIQDSRTFERIRARDRLVTLGELASGLAHEIRNPLAAIRGALDLLEDPGQGGTEVFHQVLVEEIQRLNRVVALFLDYARPSTEHQIIRDVAQLVADCATSVGRAAQPSEVKLEIEAEPGLPALEADAAQLERVIVNVVQNAYEATKGGGRVRVAVRSEPTDDARDRWIEISVEDDGPGMDEETLQRALIPFFTTKDAGTGLGLALCERLVRSQGGAIELRSRPEQGTTVLIRMPCQQLVENPA